MCINISAAPRRNHEVGSVRVIFEKSRRARVPRRRAARQKWSSFPLVIFRTMEHPLPRPRRWKENPALSSKSRGILNSRARIISPNHAMLHGLLFDFGHRTARQSIPRRERENFMRRHRKQINDSFVSMAHTSFVIHSINYCVYLLALSPRRGASLT